MKQLFYILCLCGIILTSCSSSENDGNTVKAKKSAMTVCVTPSLDCFPLYVAVETGLDVEMGYPIDLIEYLSKADCDSALVGGVADAMMTDDAHANSVKSGWVEMKRRYILAAIEKEKKLLAEKQKSRKGKNKAKKKKDNQKEEYAKRIKEWVKKAGADSLYIFPHDNLQLYLFTNQKSRLKEAKQLTDRIIAVDRQGTDAAMARYVLDSVKIAADKCFLVQIQKYDVRMKMLLVNSMDACVLPEPQATVARKMGHKSIYSGGTVNGKKAGCLFVRGNADKLRQLYNRACDSINKNGIHHYDSIMQKRYTIPVPVIPHVPKHKFQKL